MYRPILREAVFQAIRVQGLQPPRCRLVRRSEWRVTEVERRWFGWAQNGRWCSCHRWMEAATVGAVRLQPLVQVVGVALVVIRIQLEGVESTVD